MELILLVAMIIFTVSVIRQLFQNTDIDLRFALQSIVALASFALAVTVGGVLFWQVVHSVSDPGRGVGDTATNLLLVGAFLCWMGLAALWTLCKAPSLGVPPRWVAERWGAIDFVLIAGCGTGVISALLRSQLVF